MELDVNLLSETTEKLELCGKTWADVRFIDDGENCSGDVLGFKKAIDFFYDDGYGCAEINEGLKIVGENWWLERHEYDGSEWWEYKEKPIFDTKREGKIKIRED